MQAHVSGAEAVLLREQVVRSLYSRFLMYGYDESARRLLPTIERAALRHGVKGWIAWLHAVSGINLMLPARLTVQGFIGRFGQAAWRGELASQGLDLGYGER
jgi:hypothetical protein